MSKNLSFKNIFKIISHFINFPLTVHEKLWKCINKMYSYCYAPKEKTVKAARLKIVDCKGKSISQQLKKSRTSVRPGSWVILNPKSTFSHDDTLIPLSSLSLVWTRAWTNPWFPWASVNNLLVPQDNWSPQWFSHFLLVVLILTNLFYQGENNPWLDLALLPNGCLCDLTWMV